MSSKESQQNNRKRTPLYGEDYFAQLDVASRYFGSTYRLWPT